MPNEIDRLPVLPNLADRMCRAGALDNRLRRRFASPSRELDLLGLHSGMSVADLGAGVGYFARETLARIGPGGRLYLVDIDDENLAVARHTIGDPPNVVWHVGSAAHVGHIPSDSVDRVLMSLVLCCLVEKEAALDEAHRILRPGGLLLATYPRFGGSPFRRKRSLRVDRARWAALRARRPWEDLPCPQGRLVTRHLLRRAGGPGTEGSSGPGGPPAGTEGPRGRALSL